MLDPAVQVFSVDAAKFLAGIDAMLERVDKLTASIDAAVAASDRLSGMTAGLGGALDEAAGAASRAAEEQTVLSDAEKAAADMAAFERDMLADLDRGQKLLADSAKIVTDGLAAEARAMKVVADSAAMAGDAVVAAGDESAVAGDKMAASGDKAVAFGSHMKMALLGVGLALIYGIAKAASFQQQVARLYTAAGLTGSTMAKVSAQILKVGDATGYTGTRIAEALYHPVSAGLSLKASLAAVTYGAQLAQIHGANLDDTMYALSSVMKSFNIDAGGAGKAAALLNSIVGQGDMRFQDFNESIKNWAPTAASMGISIQSMGAGIAYLTDRGNTAEVAATRLTMGLSMVTSGSKQANTILQALGLTTGSIALRNQTLASVMNKAGLTTNRIAADLKKPDGLYVALTDLRGAFDKSGLSASQADQVMAKLFGGGRSDKAILALMQNLDGLKQKYESIGKGVKDYGNSWAKTQETTAYQWKQTVADAQNLAITFGAVLLPVVLRLLGGLTRFMSMLQQHPVLAAFAGAILAIAVAFKVAATATALFDAALDANPVMLVIIAIVALVAALYELYKHSKLVRDAVADVGKFFVSTWQDAVKIAGAVVTWFVNGPLAFIKQQMAVFSAFWAQHGAQIEQVASAVWGAIRDIIVTYWRIIWDGEIRPGLVILAAVWKVAWGLIRDTVTLVWDTIAAVIRTAVKVLLDVISLGLDLITGKWGAAWADLKRLVSDAINGVLLILNTFAAGALHLLWDAGVNIIEGLIGGIKSMAGAVGNVIGDIGHGIAGAFKSVLHIFSPSRVFYDLGANITKGLALGLTETAAQVYAAAAALARQVTAAFGAGQITGSQENSLLARISTSLSARKLSLAKIAASINFEKLGADITARIGSGINETMGQAQAAARKLMAAIARELAHGQISTADAERLALKIQEALTSRQDRLVKTMREIGLKMAAGMLSSLENAATASQAKSAVSKMIAYVREAWGAGDITTSRATAMTAWLEADSDRLQKLAARRQALTATIKKADAYATATATNTEQWAGLSSVAGNTTSGGMIYSGNLLAGMQANLASIRQFGAAIKKLAHMGLRKDLLNQIIQMGPAQGLQVANALLDGPGKVIGEMNRTQAQIAAGSTALGNAAANAMFDTGKSAGKGFLSGLQAQEHQVTAMFDRAAVSMAKTLRRELGMNGGKGSTYGGGPQFHIAVNGFVGNNAELVEELRKVLQEATLQYEHRNGRNGLSLSFS
jgi:TP901 family phage tail tape measure protein